MSRQHTLTGTGILLRFMLRRERVSVAIWLLSLGLLVVSTLMSFDALYASEPSRQAMAATMTNPAAVALTGPTFYLEAYTIGAMLSHQMLGMTGLAVGLMNILLIVRHTRKEEETGRAELVRASVIGRHANTTAALLLALGVNAALAALLALGIGSLGIESVTWAGSLLFAASLGAVGLVFAAATLLTAQWTEHARAAIGIAVGLLAAAYTLRAVGDIGDDRLSWLSPIGWAQRTSPYVDNDWTPLLLAAAVTVGFAAIAYPLSTRRDVGAGLMRPRAGRRTASRALTTPLGLAFRLQRTNLLVWSFAMLLIGLAYGSFVGEAEDMIRSMGDALRDMVPQVDGVLFADSMAGLFMAVSAILACVPAMQTVLKLRAEEQAGRLDAPLAGMLSRSRLFGSYIALAAGYGVVLMAMGGLGMGLAAASSMNDAGYVGKLVVAGLAFVPGVWVASGFAAAFAGALPKAAPFSWVLVIHSFLAVYLGGILQIPEWVLALSPLHHVPQLPAAAFEWTPLLALTAIAAALCLVGWAGFRRRDLNG